ncbi:PspC domain-containing protein [Sphingobacterium cellulitidis]|uniref:Phage shock protein C (PspC) family protein n=1 Tax=Sphingobacterium cellulitidis TaxID=1768011 RepID=A0A8H9KT64_9SPHI|nr:PspC domain-containing protein [Sphingobacterium soli]MBA8985298.1 phage shock protein PspC (stress-responsive transcriptional regulator) [Sphingobacterium soli]OYD41491.1 hypothetical protein CHT99_12545 [Sphingobacterium cellulitidis]GGE10765.1 hypothetical protein GCM10011516_05610 [Sphingobacterium soli]
MNKTIIININSIVFHIEEDAYETLRSYMIEIKRHFGKSEDSREILEDIENRIAEMFSERIQTGRKEVINREDVEQVISQMGRVSDFELENGDEPRMETEPKAAFADYAEGDEARQTQEAPAQEPSPEPNFTEYLTSKKLMRDMDDKVLSGVCSGLAHYFNIETKWVRVIFILFFLFGGSGVLLYFVLWAVMPKAVTRADKLAMRGEQANLHNFKKSFDEEMKGIRENFTGAGEHISRGARSVGDSLGSFFSIIGKILAVLVLIWAGLSIIGMFIFFVFNVLNIMGYQNPIFFPPLEVLDPTSAFFAILSGTVAIIIPLLALFFVMLRVVFKTRPMNNYASMTLLATWIVSIVMILYFVVVTNQDFVEESTISVEKTLDKKDTYIISENDVRVIKATDEDFIKKRINQGKDGLLIGNYLRNDISVYIEPVDSLKAPYIQYNYIAKGASYAAASARASKISYQVNQNADNLMFDSHFALQDKQLIRDQHVRMNVYLPVGTKVLLNRNMEWKVRDIWAHECHGKEESKFSEWIMTKNGLKCILKLEEEKAKEAEEKVKEAEEKAKEAEEEAKEKLKKENKEATTEGAKASSEENNA